MGLRETASIDVGKILNDSTYGFGWPIVVTNPAETSANLIGFSNDIAQLIDPETGQAVSGRFASVVIYIESFTEKGLSLPEGIADSASKPWLVAFDDINGIGFTFKVTQSNPDRAIGVVSCILELYKP